MTAGRCTLEVWSEGAWRAAAEVRVDDVAAGYRGAARLEYDFDYLDDAASALGAIDLRAVSCRYPVGYEVHDERTWPAFLLDLIPSGAARRFWERHLGAPNTPSSDWVVLVAGAGNPIGNVRVHEAAPATAARGHAGFARDDVLDRAEGFIEYARERGASVAGGTGAAGDAPKFLLREDEGGRWHADGALADSSTKAAWIVKFPRSRHDADRIILEAEAGYHRVARRLGARTGADVVWERDCLFIPRFDRTKRADGTVRRLGAESLCSLAGVAEFGEAIAKERLAEVVARFATDKERELRELLLRDVLDVALGNTDNHARNTSLLKTEDGAIALSPIYDFAPMVLDPQGIARVCRWSDEDAGYPRWRRVAEHLGSLGLDVGRTNRELSELGDRLADAPRMLRDEGVPERVVDTLDARMRRVARELSEIR